MAALNDRAQLLLVGSFVLAVALIGLTVVLNANTYTETIADEGGPAVNGGDVVTARQSIERHLGLILMEHANDDTIGSMAVRNETFVAHATNITNGTRDYHARQGRLVELSLEPFYDTSEPTDYADAFEKGERISGSSSDFPDRAFDGSSVRVRNLTVRLEEIPGDSNDPFNFTLETGGDDWNMYVYRPDSRTVVLGTDAGHGGALREQADCVFDNDVDDSTVLIAVDEATVYTDYGRVEQTERYCPALERFGRGFEAYDRAEIEHRDVSEGDFSMIVDDTGINSPGTDANPVIYNATVRFQYRSSSVNYVTDLRIAPGELP